MACPRLARRARVRRNAFALAAAGVIALCATGLRLVPGIGGLARTVDETAQDALVRTRAPGATTANTSASADPRAFITIVAIDERTLNELGAYNGGYPRSYHAQVIENLLAAPPRVIVMDLGFFELTPDDDSLAAALDHARSLPVPTSVILGAVGMGNPGRAANGELSFDRVLMPVPELAQRADVAFANMVPDDRGTVRSMPLLVSAGAIEQPTLGLAATSRYLRRPNMVDARPDPNTLELAGRLLPVDDTSMVRINFSGPPSRPYQQDATFRVVSFVDVMRGRVDPSVWRGGMVFVGALGATGLADDYWTPVSEQSQKMSGVEIHANVAATLFSTQFLRDAPLSTELAAAATLALLMALAAANLRPAAASISVLILFIGFGAASTWALRAVGLFLPIAAPVLGACVALLSTVVQRIAFDRRDAAFHDALTDLPNRLLLAERITVASRANVAHALLLFDLDNFKVINDSLGHKAGDTLLKAVAQRLQASVPKTATVARLGGDEFGIWLPIADADVALNLGTRVVAALDAPVAIAEREISLAAGLGVALYPEHGADPETLLRRAELAMYDAKRLHVAVSLFTDDLDRQSAERLTLIADLPHAIDNDELVLYCQPKIDCRTGGLAGAEALVRWRHPRHGLIPPDRFVPLAEEAGVIGPLTRWALNAALRHARAWLDAGLEAPIAINLSAHDLDRGELPAVVAELLQRWQVPSWLVSVELTETAVLSNTARAMDVLGKLAELGVRASLDDFGTGYSSLSAIQQLPLHELKIDRSFVCDMALMHRDRAIVRSTIELGHSLGLTVIAEGVEDEATFRLLGQLGCDLVQGYLFARPMPAADLPEWVRTSSFQTSTAAA